MNLLRYLIPLLFLIYFLNRAKKFPVYLCMLPILYSFGESIFISTWDFCLRVPGLPIAFNRNDIAFFLLFFVWSHFRRNRINFNKLSWGLDIGSICLMIFVCIAQPFAIALATGVFHESAILNSRYFLYFPFSILIWIDILRRFAVEEVWDLLKATAIASALLMPFYCLSAVGVPVYPFRLNWQFYTGSTLIVRDFNTFPIWTGLAAAFFIVTFIQRKKQPYLISMLFILILGALLSVTRHYVILMSIVVITGLLISMLKMQVIHRELSRIIMVTAAIVVILIVSQTFFTDSFDMLTGRLLNASAEQFDEVNFNARIESFKRASLIVSAVNRYFGLGFIGTSDEDLYSTGSLMLGDQMWVEVILRTGWSGLISLAAIMMISIFNSILIILRKDRISSQVGLILLLSMIWDVGKTFFGSGYLMFTASSVMPLALISLTKRELWAHEPVAWSRRRFWTGVNLNWFEQRDRLRPLRNTLLYLIVGVVAYYMGMLVAR